MFRKKISICLILFALVSVCVWRTKWSKTPGMKTQAFVMLISFWLLYLSIEIPMTRTLNFQYIDPELDFRNVISSFPLLHRQLVVINLIGGKTNEKCIKTYVICYKNGEVFSVYLPSNVFWSSSTCEMRRAFSSCSSGLMSGSKLELDPSLLYMLGNESLDFAWLILSLESSIMAM